MLVWKEIKNLKNFDFCAQVAVFLIENLTQIMGFLDAGSEVCASDLLIHDRAF